LSFALEIESSNPDAGEAKVDTIPVPKETVSQIFNNYIYGNVGNVAGGHGIQQSATVTVEQGSFKSLAEYLRGQGVDEEDVSLLQQAVDTDPAPTQDKPFGKKVSAWMGKMIQKSAEGGWKVATGVASNLLSGAIKSYYGLSN